MATRAYLMPEDAHFPSSNFALRYPVGGNNQHVLVFDAANDWACYWRIGAPQGLTGTLTLHIHYRMATATTGSVYFQAQIMAVSDGDAINLNTTNSFDTANSANEVVPASAGNPSVLTITLTNADGISPGDQVIIALNRDADNAGDTATGYCYVDMVEFRDAA